MLEVMGEGVCIAYIDEVTVVVVTNDFVGSTGGGGDGGEASSHTFEVDDAETFIDGRDDEEMALAHDLGELIVGERSVEGDGCLQAALVDLLLDGLGIAGGNGRVANDVEMDGVGWELGHGR